MANPSTVLLHGRDDDVSRGVAAEAITPGSVVHVSGENTDGDLQFSLQNTDDSIDVLVAAEAADAGRGVDDDYASGDYFEARAPLSGERFYARLIAGADDATTDGSDANIAVGDLLAPSGTDGTLEAAGTASNASFRAVEAVDNSGAATGEHTRIRVEAI